MAHVLSSDLLQFSDIVCTVFMMIGVTAGAHRLWSHRSYKAKWPMRLILMILQSAAYQVSLTSSLFPLHIHAKVISRRP